MANLWPPPFGSLQCRACPPTQHHHALPPLPRPCKGWLTLGLKERVGRLGSCWAFWVPQGWKSLKHSLQKVARHSVQPLVASSGGGLHSWHRMAPPTLTLAGWAREHDHLGVQSTSLPPGVCPKACGRARK